MAAEFSLHEDTDEPLWERGEVRLVLPDVGAWDVKDRANPIRETDDFNPDSRPVSYIIESLVLQLEDDQQKKARKALLSGVDDGTIFVRSLSKALRWVGEQREEAEERRVARNTGRPTSAQPPSTP